MFLVLESIVISGNEPPLNGVILPINMNIVTLWTKDNAQEAARGRLRANLEGPGTYDYTPVELEIDLTKSLFYRGRIFTQGIKWSGAGRYQFIIDYKDDLNDEWKRAAEIPFWLEFSSPPPVA